MALRTIELCVPHLWVEGHCYLPRSRRDPRIQRLNRPTSDAVAGLASPHDPMALDAAVAQVADQLLAKGLAVATDVAGPDR